MIKKNYKNFYQKLATKKFINLGVKKLENSRVFLLTKLFFIYSSLFKVTLKIRFLLLLIGAIKTLIVLLV